MNHLLINDLIALLMHVPPVLAAQWGAWFAVGLMLSIWQRREQARLVVHTPPPRSKSGVRPAAVPKKPAANTPFTAGGDAFGELEQLLDTPTRSHRTPGDLPAPQALP
jgi:hypothetical protein